MPKDKNKKPLPPESLGTGAAAKAAQKAKAAQERKRKYIEDLMGYRPRKIK